MPQRRHGRVCRQAGDPECFDRSPPALRGGWSTKQLNSRLPTDWLSEALESLVTEVQTIEGKILRTVYGPPRTARTKPCWNIPSESTMPRKKLTCHALFRMPRCDDDDQ